MKLSVTIEEIDRQRELGWPDFHPETYCHRCGGLNIPSWFVDSDRFNAAMGPIPAQHPYNGIICPGCFVTMHEDATSLTCTWKLVPDGNFRPIEDSVSKFEISCRFAQETLNRMGVPFPKELFKPAVNDISKSTLKCKFCGATGSVDWWKCCPTHTSDDDPDDVVCQLCAEERHPDLVIRTKGV